MPSIKEIEKAINSKRLEVYSKRDELIKEDDKEKVIVLGETLNKLMSELNALETKLTALKIEEPTEGERSVPVNAEKRGFNPLARFSMAGQSSQLAPSNKELDGIALRSDETFKSRCTSKENLDLGKYIRGAISGDWTNAEMERRSLVSTTHGVVIPEVLSSHILDNARNISFFLQAGIPTIPLDNNNLTIAKVLKDPIFNFYGELEEATESGLNLGSIELKAKTARGFCYISKELLYSAQNLHGVLVQAFSGAISNMIDNAFLYGGADSVAPTGILNDGEITTLTATNKYYADYIRAIAQIRRANGTPTTIGGNATVEEAMNLMLSGNGEWISPPSAMAKLDFIISNSFLDDETNGADAIVIDKNAVLIGIQKNITVRMTDTSDYCIKNHAVCFEVSALMDCVCSRPEHVVRITGIKPNADKID